jgi:hypothetical protein
MVNEVLNGAALIVGAGIGGYFRWKKGEFRKTNKPSALVGATDCTRIRGCEDWIPGLFVATFVVASTAGLLSSAAIAETKRDIQGVRLGMQRSEVEAVLHTCKELVPNYRPMLLRCEESPERVFEILFTQYRRLPLVTSVNLKFCSRDSLSEVINKVMETFGHADKALVTASDPSWRQVPMDDHTVMHFEKNSDRLLCPVYSVGYKLSLVDRDLVREEMDVERRNAPITPKF